MVSIVVTGIKTVPLLPYFVLQKLTHGKLFFKRPYPSCTARNSLVMYATVNQNWKFRSENDQFGSLHAFWIWRIIFCFQFRSQNYADKKCSNNIEKICVTSWIGLCYWNVVNCYTFEFGSLNFRIKWLIMDHSVLCCISQKRVNCKFCTSLLSSHENFNTLCLGNRNQEARV